MAHDLLNRCTKNGFRCTIFVVHRDKIDLESVPFVPQRPQMGGQLHLKTILLHLLTLLNTVFSNFVFGKLPRSVGGHTSTERV